MQRMVRGKSDGTPLTFPHAMSIPSYMGARNQKKVLNMAFFDRHDSTLVISRVTVLSQSWVPTSVASARAASVFAPLIARRGGIRGKLAGCQSPAVDLLLIELLGKQCQPLMASRLWPAASSNKLWVRIPRPQHHASRQDQLRLLATLIAQAVGTAQGNLICGTMPDLFGCASHL